MGNGWVVIFDQISKKYRYLGMMPGTFRVPPDYILIQTCKHMKFHLLENHLDVRLPKRLPLQETVAVIPNRQNLQQNVAKILPTWKINIIDKTK